MRSYAVTLTGKSPFLAHADNIEWADEMDAWKKNPQNKEGSKAGDDRSPAFRWIGSLYHDGQRVAILNDNLMRAFMEGGAMVPTGGKNGKTFKAQTQSGMLVCDPYWPLLVGGAVVPIAPVLALQGERDFAVHRATVDRLGFSLFVKRAKIGASKHVRVRPRFEQWSTSGTVHVWDDAITKDVLTNLVTQAGLYKGLGDWRPGGRTPGPFGMFTATVA